MGKDGPATTIAGRNSDSLERKETLSKPGPGQYDPNLDIPRKNSPAFKIGTAKRDDFGGKEKDAKPSPSVYNPNDTFTKN
jgi:hypothetical protein